MSEHIETGIEQPEEHVNVITDVPEAPYNSLLKVFEAIFSGLDKEREERITPVNANRIVSLHPQLNFKQLPLFYELYFEKLVEIRSLLEFEIENAGDDVNVEDSAEDVEVNGERYKNLLLQWQLALQIWDLEWDVTADDAVEQMASSAEVFKFLFGQTGITQFFGDIGFHLDEDDQKLMADAIIEAREGK